MVFLYIDESGDLGSDSSYFVLTCVAVEDDKTHKKFMRIPKTVRKTCLKKKVKKTSELKFTNSSHAVRTNFLRRIAKLDIKVHSIIFDKGCSKKHKQGDFPARYASLVSDLLSYVLAEGRHPSPITLVFDKCMSEKQYVQFEREILSLLPESPALRMKQETSQKSNALQVVDFICGAIGHKYNRATISDDADKYSAIIGHSIRSEYKWKKKNRQSLFTGPKLRP